MWSVPRTTGEFLQFLIELINPQIVLELGCSVGYSTLFLANGLKKGHIYTTEILTTKIRLAKNNFKKAKLDKKITLIEDNIMDVLKNWDKNKKIDFIFLDADKDNYEKYYKLFLPLLKKGGLLVIDNTGKYKLTHGPKVNDRVMKEINKFTDKLKKDKRIFTYYLNIDNGLFLACKK